MRHTVSARSMAVCCGKGSAAARENSSPGLDGVGRSAEECRGRAYNVSKISKLCCGRRPDLESDWGVFLQENAGVEHALSKLDSEYWHHFVLAGIVMFRLGVQERNGTWQLFCSWRGLPTITVPPAHCSESRK